MCSDAPTPDPRMAEAALRNAQLGEEAFRWYQGVYDRDLKPAQDEDRAMRQQLIQQFMTDSALQREFAREQNEYYQQTFKPIEEQMARDAMNYDSDENIARRQGIAGAAVTQAFSNAQQQATRNASRMGINPNSGAFAALNARLTNAQALGVAGARSGAAFDTIDRGIALRAGAANFGRNMPNTAAGYFGLANQSGAMAGQTSAGGMDAMRANAAMMGQGFNMGMQGYTNAANIYNQDFQGRMAGYNAQMQMIGGIGQGLGMAAGAYMGKPPSSKSVKEEKREIPEGKALRGIRNLEVEDWKYKDGVADGKRHVGPYAEDFKREFGVGDGKSIALQDAVGVTMKAVQDLAEKVDKLEGKRGIGRADGGKMHKGTGPVSGPGGPIDDKIPAMLSDGEYVLPADTVQKVGVETLDRLVKNTHVPAAVQRRRGLKRKGK
jgi:hypothetical protein